MILTSKRITKALIRLRGCAGWSLPLFANAEEWFSRIEAQLVLATVRFMGKDSNSSQQKRDANRGFRVTLLLGI